MELTVVSPVFNEVQGIAQMIDAICDQLDEGVDSTPVVSGIE